jgi:hypothetical protein
MTTVDWFPKPLPRAHTGAGGALVRIAVGGAAGGVLFGLGHPALAIAAWSLTGAIGGISLFSTRARRALAKALSWFGRMVGSAVGSALLTLVFVFGITPARLVKALSGSDDLRLRPARLPSYFEPCDPEERKVRYARTMFATETHQPKRGGLVVALVTLLALLGIAELVLRANGFGPGAIVYTPDARAGYYPAGNQKSDRYGGRVQTNRYGMRAPDFDDEKPADTFRIFMIGDSTLWGGSYVDQRDLYARLVERKLGALAQGVGRVEVLNMGVNGWGPFHKRGFVEEFGAFDADVALVCMPIDDLDRDKYTLASLPFFAKQHPPILALEEVAQHAAWRFSRERHPLDSEWFAAQRDLGLREYERLVLYLRDGDPRGELTGPPPRTKVGGADVFVEILPSKTVGFGGPPGDIEGWSVRSLVERLAPHGIPVRYPAGLFAGKGRPDEVYHDDCHLHRAGHALYADYLVGEISSSARFKDWLAAKGAKAAL